MAESGTSGSWWGGWIQSAKEKAVSSLEFVKKDLTEFSNVMHKDTSTAAVVVKEKLNQETATEATKKVKDGMSSILGGISKALIIEPEDKYDRGQPVTVDSHIFDRAKTCHHLSQSRIQARLRAIQLDPETYCNDPVGDPADYTNWLAAFVLEDQKGAISELLVSNVEVRGLYTQLVPSQISHANFWQRYFYKVHQLEQDEARKAALKKRAEVGAQEAELEWDDDDEWGDLESPVPSSSSATDSSVTTSTETAETKIESPSTCTHPASSSTSSETTTDEVPKPSSSAKESREDEGSEQKLLIIDSSCSLSSESDGKSSPDKNYVKVSAVMGEGGAEGGSSETVAPIGVPPQSASGSAQPKADAILPAIDIGRDKDDTELSAVADVHTKDKGDLVVVGDRNTPSSDSSQSKELSSVDDDWEKDFDIEVSEEDIRLAQEAARKLAESKTSADDDDDWENWD